MRLIDGRAIAAAITDEVTAAGKALRETDVTPVLGIVVPTRDEGTAWYVRSIARAAAKVGVACRVDELIEPPRRQIVETLDRLSRDPAVHGVICLTPLPSGLRLADVAEHIAPEKDVDGVNPTSLGRLAAGLPSFAPATAAAIMEILHREQTPLVGRNVVVVGRSNVVGKPAALLLLAENATVTVCHSHTADLADVCVRADVLVAAVGQAHVINDSHVKPGAVVVDVGTNPTPDGGLVGDVDPVAVGNRAAALVPVPGGVGPVTTSLLLRNTVTAAQPPPR